MTQSYFITGTDTEVGKTWATITLMHYFKQQGLSVIAMKPVAAGCTWHDGQLKNEDALLMQKYASIELDYKQVNPFAFEKPVSPHLAAGENQVDFLEVSNAYQALKNDVQVLLVEGAGGWLSPITDSEDNASLAKMLNIPVILVVAIRLGCINHARLTYQAIQVSGVECAGWIAMNVDPKMAFCSENITTITNKLNLPLLGVLPFVEHGDFSYLAQHILSNFDLDQQL